MTRRYDHVAFDLDGTLVDSRADLAAATNHVLASFGLPLIAPETVHRFVGEGARRLVERALGPAHAARVDEGVARFLAYYADHLLDATTLYPGVVAALDALARAGVVLTVLSNKPAGMSRVVLEGLGVAGRFAAVVGGDSLPTRKPDPAGLALLGRVAGARPGRTLLVGDSTVDLATAANAGVDFCGVAWGLDPATLRAAGPARMVASAAALVALVLAPQPERGAAATTSS